MATIEQNLTLARKAFENKDFQEAINFYFLALKAHPSGEQKAVIWAEISWAFYYKGAYQRAVEAAQNVLDMGDTYQAREDLLRLMGFSYIQLGQDEQAIATLEQSLQIDRESAKQQIALFELAKLYFKRQDYATAAKLLEEVEPYLYQHEREYWLSALFYRGFIHYYRNEYERSESVFEELLEQARDDKRKATAFYGLAFVAFSRKQYLDTINLCEQVATRDPDFFDMETVGFLTAASFYNLGRVDVFEKYYYELKKKYPSGRYTKELDQLHKNAQNQKKS